MKKLISILLVIVMLVSCVSLLAACDDSSDSKNPESTENGSTNDSQNSSNENNSNNNNTTNTPTAKAEWISNRSISYVDDENRYRFCFALKDKSENYISCNARVEMSIVNELGETVYSGTKTVTSSDYGEWYNIYEEWLGTAVYIYDNEITAGLCEEGTFYYKVITDDNWFEYSLEIYDLPTYTPSFSVGDKWTVNGEWELTITNIELHNGCESNTDLAQYVLISYKYMNLGNKNSSGLAFTEYDFNVYDANGNLATKSTCWDHAKSAEWIDVGTQASASVLVGFESSTQSIKIVASHYDSNYNTIKATFNGTVSECNHNVVPDKGYAATCVNTGLTDGTHCSKCGLTLSKQTEIPVSDTNHNYSNGYCGWCFEKDPSYKTPDIILGEYVQSHGTKQSNGEYVISWQDETTLTQIIWNPTEKSLIFAQVAVTSIGVTTSGIIYEHGAYMQKITVINDQTSTGTKITGIGYIYSNTYTLSNDSIYSYQCDASSSSLISASKSLAETCIKMLVVDIDDWLEKNTDFDITDFGFTSW